MIMTTSPARRTTPDSHERTVIAPDLSNLPAGQDAVDPVTGEHVHRPDPEEKNP